MKLKDWAGLITQVAFTTIDAAFLLSRLINLGDFLIVATLAYMAGLLTDMWLKEDSEGEP